MEDQVPRRYQQASVYLDDEEKKAITELRNKLQAMKDILYCPLDDEFLIRFLRVKKNNVGDSLKTIERFFEMKNIFNLSDVPYSSLANIWDSKSIMVLKNRDGNGVQILYMRVGPLNAELSVEEFRLAFFLVAEEMTSSEETQKNGCCFIIDYGGLTFSQAKHIASFFSLAEMKFIAKCCTGAYPARIKAIYTINMRIIYASIAKVFKLLLKEKLRKRIFIGSGDIVKNNLNPNILPISLGGTLPDDEAFDFDLHQRALKNYQYFQDTRKYGFIPSP